MIMSVPSITWFLSGEESISSGYVRTGRRFANTPIADRMPSKPFSGRLSGAALSNSGRPTAPISVGLAAKALSRVSFGSGVPVLWMAMPPISPSDNSRVWPSFLATACRTSTAALVTSTPIPSPGRIRIFRFIIRLVLAGASSLALFEHLAREGGDFVVPHAFLAIRHGGETVVHGVELLTVEIEAQVFASLGER